MSTLKVYGINGLLEWHGFVNANGVKMKVDFTNGSVTAFGVAPATFSTRNELTQFILENSDMYKSGRIRIVQVVHEEGDEPKPEGENREARIPMAQTEPVKADEAAVTAAASTETETEAAEAKVVEVSCNDDAKDYMVENYGVSRSKMRNRDQIEAVAKENGVVFSWI